MKSTYSVFILCVLHGSFSIHLFGLKLLDKITSANTWHQDSEIVVNRSTPRHIYVYISGCAFIYYECGPVGAGP